MTDVLLHCMAAGLDLRLAHFFTVFSVSFPRKIEVSLHKGRNEASPLVCVDGKAVGSECCVLHLHSGKHGREGRKSECTVSLSRSPRVPGPP